MKYGNVLKEMRQIYNTTQKAMAKSLKVDQAYLCRCENDKLTYPLSEELIIKYATVLGLNPWPWLFKANRFPSEMATSILSNQYLFDFLSVALRIEKQLPAFYWEKLTEELKFIEGVTHKEVKPTY